VNQMVKTLTASRTWDYSIAAWIVNQVFDG